MPFGILRDHFLLTLSYIVVHFAQIDLLLVHLTLDILMDDIFLFALSFILVAVCIALFFVGRALWLIELALSLALASLLWDD